MIEQVGLLSPDECAAIQDQVIALQGAWTPRMPFLPAYTLGAASYIDGAHSKLAYRGAMLRSNPVLKAHFDGLHQQLAGALESLLHAPVRYEARLALPGFHIFYACEHFKRSVASVHADLQFQLIDWRMFGTEAEGPDSLSYTLAISLPRSGGGMNVWDMTDHEISAQPDEWRLESEPRTYYPYRLGGLFLHRGLCYHQIAPMPDAEPGEHRITLQGHATKVDGVYLLYW